MSIFNTIAVILFILALLHTFTASQFAKLSHRYPKHHGLLHLLSEIEVVFGFWAFVMLVFMAIFQGKVTAISYIESRNFVEPLFVFVIMVIAASKPILDLLSYCVQSISKTLPQEYSGLTFLFCCLVLLPLLGSLITEPAAMTVAALLLRETIFIHPIKTSMKYGILAVLFVNISIGGSLTAYAAPPILMVAGTWGWDTAHVFMLFGEKALLAVLINATLLCYIYRKELLSIVLNKNSSQNFSSTQKNTSATPLLISIIHLVFLASVVIFSHHPTLFVGFFLFFLGFTQAYARYQSRLLLREALLVAFFLGGLVILGGQQSWWLQPLLSNMSENLLFFGTIGLTAFTDNAAITYLGSLVSGVNDAFKYAIVSGALVGGGLTIIANAPNPAGAAILREHFPNKSIHAGLLATAALIPTCITAACFYFL
jgi:hypothetical protein